MNLHTQIYAEQQKSEVKSDSCTPVRSKALSEIVPSEYGRIISRCIFVLECPYVTGIHEYGSGHLPYYVESVFDIGFKLHISCLIRDYEGFVHLGSARSDCPGLPSSETVRSTAVEMLSPDEALALTGHAVGGVCPFALPKGVDVYLDASLCRFDTVYPAAGSSNSAVELSCDELFRTSGALEWVDVCKPREN